MQKTSFDDVPMGEASPGELGESQKVQPSPGLDPMAVDVPQSDVAPEEHPAEPSDATLNLATPVKVGTNGNAIEPPTPPTPIEKTPDKYSLRPNEPPVLARIIGTFFHSHCSYAKALECGVPGLNMTLLTLRPDSTLGERIPQ